jgi:hypothetical protein
LHPLLPQRQAADGILLNSRAITAATLLAFAIIVKVNPFAGKYEKTDPSAMYTERVPSRRHSALQVSGCRLGTIGKVPA